ncbi:MAG: hypothetical protein KatS3mg052_2503 [Candidatus Roseilinea sp.]|nr:MAG: hypothetical protein KatS3mg052_2503 [Candidatus Roseilinea sp.]
MTPTSAEPNMSGRESKRKLELLVVRKATESLRPMRVKPKGRSAATREDVGRTGTGGGMFGDFVGDAVKGQGVVVLCSR